MFSQNSFADDYIDLLKQALCASLYDESAWRRIEGPMAQNVPKFSFASVTASVKHAVIGYLRKRKIILVRQFKYDDCVRRQGLDWPLFGYTMTGRLRLDTLQRLLTEVIDANIQGDIVETGVWRGGSMILARALLKIRNIEGRRIWCADSFEGMPLPREQDRSKSSQEDFSDRDYLAVSLDQVKANFARFGLLDETIEFLKGWFSDTLPSAPIDKISLLRLDGDLYESTRDAITPLYDKVSNGGYIIVDDYNSWPGCKKAIDEFRAHRGINTPLVAIDDHAVYWRREE